MAPAQAAILSAAAFPSDQTPHRADTARSFQLYHSWFLVRQTTQSEGPAALTLGKPALLLQLAVTWFGQNSLDDRIPLILVPLCLGWLIDVQRLTDMPKSDRTGRPETGVGGSVGLTLGLF